MARPRIPLLSKPIIRDTALKLVDENGLTDFSMRKLATVLGVQAPSLYSHYANKDELLDDVANVIMESVDVSGFDSDDWRGALRTWARSYHAALGKHPNIVPYLAYGPSVRPIAARPSVSTCSSIMSSSCLTGSSSAVGWDSSGKSPFP